MAADDILECLAYALPWLALAGVLYAFAFWKKSKGRKLHAEAREHLATGDLDEARDRLLQALWKANEEPEIERRILADLDVVCQRSQVDFRSDDYEVLILQFEQLSKKGSHKALAEMKKVQALKWRLIERMPAAA